MRIGLNFFLYENRIKPLVDLLDVIIVLNEVMLLQEGSIELNELKKILALFLCARFISYVLSASGI